ncbi:hypothetical protein [Lacimonas salitolerans]|uniref:Insulinase family protein n=1 Tax=Lacimonas salitolerans TaxID=1323750 RepID=A0ABW4EFC8_9RHOB
MQHIKRPLLATLICLGLGLPALADTSIDVVAPFEIQSPEPSTSGHIFIRMGISEAPVDADPQGWLRPGLATD